MWAENHLPGMLGKALKRRYQFPVVVDLHGAVPEESLELWGDRPPSLTQRLKMRAINEAERRIVREADGIVVVSRSMVEHLELKYGAQLGRHIEYPCAVDLELFVSPTEGAATRSREGFGLPKNEPLLVYSGGMQPWQMVEDTLMLWQALCARKRCAMLVLTTDSHDAHALVTKVFRSTACSRPLIMSVPAPAMSALVPAGDLGFVLRRDSIVNRVSFPTKCGEYLACGLPVVTSAFAGPCASIVASEHIGRVVDLGCPPSTSAPIVEELLDAVMADRNDWRRRCRSAAERIYNSATLAQRLTECLAAI